ncbi:G-protein-signaling modulator 3 isoform X4 [Sarcophilus harrisii]|uniref:G-protein-signaling modulator 3 isoform X4 n=1 Tax=Sarcophilus harrisii TaxID=9305 RepID=UPI001301D155|nr:G-protein-signaling modulator 3 isoform X4 [Sarcophilus harrisii]
MEGSAWTNSMFHFCQCPPGFQGSSCQDKVNLWLRCPSLQPPLLPPIPFSPPPTNGDGDRETPGRRRRAFPQMIKAGPLSILSDLGDLHPQVLLIPEIKTKCQRIEAQRSDPPLPPGGQELLELLLRVQGNGRMEEQRSRPPSHTC